VIEAFLEVEEVSVLAITDGRDVVLLPASQDHKRLNEGDTGPNTGGMGAYAPVSIATPALLARVEREVLQPTLAEMERRGARFAGVLYAGLMIGPNGAPSVVEFNCRLGDPETQVVLPLCDGGLTDCFERVATGRAPSRLALPPERFAVTTVLAARGYPDAAEKGAAITIPRLPADVIVFHAGTRLDEAGILRASGGRVLNVTGIATTFENARTRSRDGAAAIGFDGKVFRRDIGWREAARR
jgi:phosphoribosylamine--glycine ligase